jgi:putative redox protein
MQASTTWVTEDRFIGVASSGHAIVVDASHLKLGSSPLELVLIGLCGCTASDVTTILRKKREPFSLLEVRAVAERAPEPPSVFTAIKLLYRVSSSVSQKSMEDAVRLSKDKYCSVSQMLQQTATITAEIEYVD